MRMRRRGQTAGGLQRTTWTAWMEPARVRRRSLADGAARQRPLDEEKFLVVGPGYRIDSAPGPEQVRAVKA